MLYSNFQSIWQLSVPHTTDTPWAKTMGSTPFPWCKSRRRPSDGSTHHQPARRPAVSHRTRTARYEMSLTWRQPVCCVWENALWTRTALTRGSCACVTGCVGCPVSGLKKSVLSYLILNRGRYSWMGDIFRWVLLIICISYSFYRTFFLPFCNKMSGVFQYKEFLWFLLLLLISSIW